jgi:hypothetical protein
MTLDGRIRGTLGADCVLGNEMKGKILDVAPVIVEDNIETSIDLSTFTIKLDLGQTIKMPGWTIAAIKKAY